MSIRFRLLFVFIAVCLVLAGLAPPQILSWWVQQYSPYGAWWMNQPVGMHPTEVILIFVAALLWMTLPLGPAWHFLMRGLDGVQLPRWRTMLVHSLGGYVFSIVAWTASVGVLAMIQTIQ